MSIPALALWSSLTALAADDARPHPPMAAEVGLGAICASGGVLGGSLLATLPYRGRQADSFAEVGVVLLVGGIGGATGMVFATAGCLSALHPNGLEERPPFGRFLAGASLGLLATPVLLVGQGFLFRALRPDAHGPRRGRAGRGPLVVSRPRSRTGWAGRRPLRRPPA